MTAFGTLIADLRIQDLHPKIIVVTPVIEFLLRLLIAVTITILIDQPVFAVIVLNFAFIFYAACMTANSLFEDQSERKRMRFNAIAYLAINYHLYLFTSYTNAAVLGILANSAILIVLVSIGLNLWLTTHGYFIFAFKQLQRLYLQCRHKQRVASKTAQI